MEHVSFQIPNDHRRVGYLLNAVNCHNKDLQATMEIINNDKTPTGICKCSEAAVLHLFPYDPVKNKHSDCTTEKSDLANISNTAVKRGNVASLGKNKGIGKGGVHICYHSLDKYKQLKKYEKDKL